jgi:threonine/homoserine/homoserine lactone efflux protein
VRSVLLGFALGWLGSMPLAGPVSALVVKRGLTGRTLHGLMVATGAALAETGWCAAALFGYGALLDRWDWLRPAAGAVGGVLLVTLGLRLALGRHLHEPGRDAPTTSRHGWAGEFILGFSIVTVNVSVLLSWLGVLAALHALGIEMITRDARLQFVIGLPVGIMAWFSLLIWLLGHTRSRISHDWVGRALRVLGVVLSAAGVYALIAVAHAVWG